MLSDTNRALKEIKTERQRQIKQLGCSEILDDRYVDAQLAIAAAAYLTLNKSLWPFDLQWWRPASGYRRRLVKAGALIIAEIERLDRIEARKVKS